MIHNSGNKILLVDVSPGPGRRRLFLIFLAALVVSTPLLMAQVSRPDFSGRWELDKAQSDFGSIPPDESATELIDHKDPKLNITQHWKNAEGEYTRVWQLTTDGAENVNRADGTEIRSRTHWEDTRLITEWEMKSQANLVEGKNIRAISEDGKTQAVHVQQRSAAGDTTQHLVFVKQSP
jgi:hypothetical protein